MFETVLIFFFLFSLFCSVAVISIILSFNWLILFPVILLSIPCSVCLISLIMFALTVCFFFSTSRSLLNFSHIFLICMHWFFFWNFGSSFLIISLNSFFKKIVYLLLIYLVFRFLPCSLIYNIFLYRLIFIDSRNCVSILLIAWAEPYNTGSCRQLGGIRSWCQDNDQWGKAHID